MILITGASRGIGRFLFKSFRDLNKEPVFGTYLNSIPDSDQSSYFKVDVSDHHQVEQFVIDNRDVFEKITLINCAGINFNSYTHKGSPENWKKVIETNLFGSYNMIRYLLPIMREQKFGRIINFSSVVALKPTPGVSAYAASKSALWGLARSVASENSVLNITINNINMGYSVLGMIKEVPEEYLNTIISQIPSKRLCDGNDILSTVNFLRTTSYVNGTSIELSGGLV